RTLPNTLKPLATRTLTVPQPMPVDAPVTTTFFMADPQDRLCNIEGSRRFAPGNQRSRGMTMRLFENTPVLAFLLIATILEVSGDALVRLAIFHHAGPPRLALFLG